MKVLNKIAEEEGAPQCTGRGDSFFGETFEREKGQ